MVPSLRDYLSNGSETVSPEEKNEPLRALPASWYTSQEMYELERRAIFSRKWLLITHKLRFTQPGDWLRYDVSGFQFVLCRDRDGKINAFHNVCRHRAFPVVTEEKGTARIFACRYHGWSYGLSGKLAKAPGYQELEGFDKTKNNLLPIHVHIDGNGFVWVNFDGKEKPEVTWDADFEGIDTQKRLRRCNYHDYNFDHTWETDGQYNWKILADNHNEYYHRQVTQSEASSDLEAYSVTTKGASIQHSIPSTPEQVAAGLDVTPTFFFPNASLSAAPHFFFIQRFVPQGTTTSLTRYEVYRHKDATDEQFNIVNDTYQKIMSENKYLCTEAQKNVSAGVFVNGEMHPTLEKGPLLFQKLVRDEVTVHRRREEEAKQEIWPARQTLPSVGGGLISQKDVDFCSGLACSTNQEGLAW